MKMLLSFAFVLLACVASGTTPQPSVSSSDGSEVIKMRINSSKSDCTGYNGNTQCFMVQKGASIGKENWEMLREPIEGFNYEAGYVYDVTVRIESVENPAQGQARVRYVLVDVIAKIPA